MEFKIYSASRPRIAETNNVGVLPVDGDEPEWGFVARWVTRVYPRRGDDVRSLVREAIERVDGDLAVLAQSDELLLTRRGGRIEAFPFEYFPDLSELATA